ncbi:MAG: anaerobic ribonucleoside-triphosphate reductase [Nanoarchaeota archaeon]|nr:anaerobic ribonucleoside-triphosphate reductase [Nanoarchaeota archaeon]
MKKVIKCEVFTRVVGYYRPVQQFNDGKKQEFFERKVYCENEFKCNDKFKTESTCLTQAPAN